MDGYIYYVTDDGKHLYNSKMKERPIQVNKKRQDRRYIKFDQQTIFLNKIIANAFPEICGEMYEGCDVHHIDGDCTNDSAYNLKVMTKEEHRRLHDGVIVKYDLYGNKLGEYTTSYEAAISVGKPHKHAAIRECLCGKSRTSCGYIWKREH